MAVKTSGQSYEDEVWEAMKPLIEEKYVRDSMTLKDTMSALREAKDFHATEKMYKTRFKKWGWSKYIKDDKALAVLGHDGVGRSKSVAMIHNRPVTKDEAAQHLKRKKRFNTEPTFKHDSMDVDQPMLTPAKLPQSMSMEIPATRLFDGSEYLTSPAGEQQIVNFPQRAPSFSREDSWGRRGTLTNGITSPVVQDMDYDDEMAMEITDLANGVNITTDGEEQLINPQIFTAQAISWTTENFLYSMRDFALRSVQSAHGQAWPAYEKQRFNKLWDVYCTDATHREQDKIQDALVTRKQAQLTFENMLTNSDPWLLLSLCLLLIEHLSNDKRKALSWSFLNEMATWAENVAPSHPITEVVRYLLQSDEAKDAAALWLLEGTIRMISDTLKSDPTNRYSDLELEISRLHARVLTTAKQHNSAIALLSLEMKDVEEIYGRDSLPNLLRNQSLARVCFHHGDKFKESRSLYTQILGHPLIDGPNLADVKYSAMFFLAKCHAELFDFDAALHQAQASLIFASTTQGPDHYWISGSRDLIKEIRASTVSMASIFGTRVRDGVPMQTWAPQHFQQIGSSQYGYVQDFGDMNMSSQWQGQWQG